MGLASGRAGWRAGGCADERVGQADGRVVGGRTEGGAVGGRVGRWRMSSGKESGWRATGVLTGTGGGRASGAGGRISGGGWH